MNNNYSFWGKVNGKLMQFATEQEYYEYIEMYEN